MKAIIIKYIKKLINNFIIRKHNYSQFKSIKVRCLFKHIADDDILLDISINFLISCSINRFNR